MKQVRLSAENEQAVSELVKDANLSGLLTFPKATNFAIQKGLPVLRKLFVKQTKTTRK